VAARDSEATSCVGGRAHVKDLSRLGRDLARVVLVDDSAWAFLAQPANGVPIAPFLGNLGDRRAPMWRLMCMVSNLRHCLVPRMRADCFCVSLLGCIPHACPCSWIIAST